MDKKAKLEQALKMSQATKNKSEAWVLLDKMDQLEDKIANIKLVDGEDEEIVVELNIV